MHEVGLFYYYFFLHMIFFTACHHLQCHYLQISRNHLIILSCDNLIFPERSFIVVFRFSPELPNILRCVISRLWTVEWMWIGKYFLMDYKNEFCYLNGLQFFLQLYFINYGWKSIILTKVLWCSVQVLLILLFR